MPQFNLTTLSGAELRNLLDSARARGEARLSYQILQEMAGRRAAGGEGRRRLFQPRRAAEPRVIDINLDDPLEPADELPPAPNWRPPAPPEPQAAIVAPKPAAEPAAEPSPETALVIEMTHPARRRRAPAKRAKPSPVPEAPSEPLPTLDLKPRGVWDDEPEPPKAKPASVREPRPRPRRIGLAAAFVVGAAAGVVAGWGVSQVAPPTAAPIQTAAATRTPAPPPVLPVTAEPAPVAEAPPEPAAEAPAVEVAEEPAAPADIGEVHDATGEALELPGTEAAPPLKKADATPRDLCATQPTPADREICGDPNLRRLQRELRQAYAEALDAHEDRAVLRERQLAWADARDEISDPQRLARLYEQRIRKLNAATAEARRLR